MSLKRPVKSAIRLYVTSPSLVSHRLLLWKFVIATILSVPGVAYAHERWVRHEVLQPIRHEYFQALNHDMVSIAVRVTVILAFLFCLWFLRDALIDIIERGILQKLKGKPQSVMRGLACFLTDKAVIEPWFQGIGRWTTALFMRAPALLLVYAAANRSLIMPSYPLAPDTAVFFQYLQVGLAIAIVTQLALPAVGVIIAGIFGYLLFAYDWKIFIDILPVAAVVGIYITAGWDSFRDPVTKFSRRQMRWIRISLGLSFFLLGWMKIYNYALPIGVADNYPSVLNDPMIKMLYIGTSLEKVRENWALAFGLAEVMTGFMMMVGAWSRVWSFMTAFVFTKLLFVDFGWEEIPHLYPVSAFCAVIFSNNLTETFSRIEQEEERQGRQGKTMAQILLAGAAAGAAAVSVIFPLLYLLTQISRRW